MRKKTEARFDKLWERINFLHHEISLLRDKIDYVERHQDEVNSPYGIVAKFDTRVKILEDFMSNYSAPLPLPTPEQARFFGWDKDNA